MNMAAAGSDTMVDFQAAVPRVPDTQDITRIERIGERPLQARRVPSPAAGDLRGLALTAGMARRCTLPHPWSGS
jgi:hypothetical protein